MRRFPQPEGPHPLAGALAAARARAGEASAAARRLAGRVPPRLGSLLDRLPEAVRSELRDSFRRLARIRSFDEAGRFVTEEVERLLCVVAPSFARYPLPVGPLSGRLLVAATAGGAALVEEFEAVATLFTGGAAAPGAPVVLAADFAALVVEAYVATSVRVNDLGRAGLAVVPEEVARDLAQAMTGSPGPSQGEITKALAGAIARRVLRRWAAGAAPLAGIAYDGWDAQKTVAAMAALPLPHPDPHPGAHPERG